MSTADPTPGDDAPDFPDNDRAFLEEQAPVEVGGVAVDANLDREAQSDETDDEPGSDADAARD